jgi:N-acetylmuramoyl-L-alanine amidase
MKICIDPGHGGRDPGAIGRDPFVLRETDVVWSVSTAVRALLEARGHETLTSHPQASYVYLSERAQAANDWGADLFISIHANSATTSQAHGMEVLHYGSETGERLARGILESLVAAFPGHRNRGLKKRPELTVLRRTLMPAALVELEFLSNPEQLVFLADGGNQAALARAIAAGIE